MPARRFKQRTQKLAITGNRRGEIRFETAYNARDAARAATAMAKKGYLVDVTAFHSGRLKMRCVPVKRSGALSPHPLHYDKPGAHCTVKPPFKKQIKGRVR
jgi:hypothetical protein